MGSVQGIEIIPIGAIEVVNPRARNRRIFKEIVTSVAELGLGSVENHLEWMTAVAR
jgi:ParB family transcriptional regulator, chromosome partitioning protein